MKAVKSAMFAARITEGRKSRLRAKVMKRGMSLSRWFEDVVDRELGVKSKAGPRESAGKEDETNELGL